MNCEHIRESMQDEIDGALSAEFSRALREHLSSCDSCRVEFEAFEALDEALAARPLDRAPRWLPDAVLTEIGRRVSTRERIERVVISTGVPAGIVSIALGVRAVVVNTGSGEAVSNAASRLTGPLGEAVAPLIESPGLSVAWLSDPGAQGVVWALAAAALAFLAITALRFSSRHLLEWN
jgi:anti-sigma factor RsiW